MVFDRLHNEATSFVRGHEIHLSPASLRVTLGLLAVHDSLLPPRGWHFTDPLYLDALRAMTGNPDLDVVSRPPHRHLTPSARLLHNIIGYTLAPKSGHFNKVSTVDFYLLSHLL